MHQPDGTFNFAFSFWTMPARTDIGEHHLGFLRDCAFVALADNPHSLCSAWHGAAYLYYNVETLRLPQARKRLILGSVCAPQEPPGLQMAPLALG
jgi:hypothetical protein